MFRVSALALLVLCLCPLAFSQSTTVSGTITDAGGQSWNNGTFNFVFVPSPQSPVGPYTWTGGTLPTNIGGSLSGTGTYSVSIPSNSAISPIQTAWTVTFCPQASSGCFTISNVSITGATQTLNATPPAILINLQSAQPPVLAYTDSEVTGAALGSQYFNLVSLGLKTCTAISGNNCTTWTAAGTATNATNLVGPGSITGSFSGTHTESGAVTFSNASSTFAGNAATATSATSATSATNATTATNLTGPGAITGTFSGTSTLTGNLTQQGNNTHSGTEAFKYLENMRFADQFAGGNVTAQINAAITDCGSVNPCWVVVPASMGPGEPTAGYSTNIWIWDQRLVASDTQMAFKSSRIDTGIVMYSGATAAGEGPGWGAQNTATTNNRNTSFYGRWGDQLGATGSTDSVVTGILHLGFWDGTNWHPQFDFLAGPQPNSPSRMRIGSLGGIIINPVGSAGTDTLDPDAGIQSATITTISEATNTVTVNTSAVCPFTTGQQVSIAGVGATGTQAHGPFDAYNGNWAVLTPGCNGGSSFTYTNPTAGLGSTTVGTVNGNTGILLSINQPSGVLSTNRYYRFGTDFFDSTQAIPFRIAGHASVGKSATPVSSLDVYAADGQNGFILRRNSNSNTVINTFTDGSGNATFTVGTGAGAATVTLTGGTGNVQAAQYSLVNLLESNTAPTIAAGGCGGTVASISAPNGTASFNIFTGTAPTSGGCTITMPAATTDWHCEANHVSAISTTNFIIQQTGALSTTSVTLQLFSDVAAATAPTASDTWRVTCTAN